MYSYVFENVCYICGETAKKNKLKNDNLMKEKKSKIYIYFII